MICEIYLSWGRLWALGVIMDANAALDVEVNPDWAIIHPNKEIVFKHFDYIR